MKNNLDDILEEKNLDKKIKKIKRKSTLKVLIISILISIIVFVSGLVLNINININKSEEAREIEDTIVSLNIPNGYISESFYDFGLLGGKAHYKVSKEIGPKSVVLRDYQTQYGLIPFIDSMHYYTGGRYVQSNDEISPEFWDTGYRKMIFYHPQIKYNMYKNDLEALKEIPDGKIIEMGISFDKEYDISDINIILPDVNKSWIWLNMFTDEYMDNIKYEVKNYDANAVYIREQDTLGISMHRVDVGTSSKLKTRVEELFKLLKKSPIDEHNKIYIKYKEKEQPKMIGAIVYGTKDELIKLKENPHIKSTSIGIVEDIY